MEKEEFSPSYIEDTIKSVKSWLRHFEVEIRRRIKITNLDSTPTLENERVPNTEELSEMLNRSSLRESVIISLIAKSGLRPQMIGNHNGTDGLKIGDLPDLIIEEKEVKIPTRTAKDHSPKNAVKGKTPVLYVPKYKRVKKTFGISQR
ncbi:MAG: hypothetical protein KGL95_01715 [Patescibacteria group bacterium]|nr:hypothetical protein [Patescibacteria group bacterium]